jgi:hypothetical protein
MHVRLSQAWTDKPPVPVAQDAPSTSEALFDELWALQQSWHAASDQAECLLSGISQDDEAFLRSSEGTSSSCLEASRSEALEVLPVSTPAYDAWQDEDDVDAFLLPSSFDRCLTWEASASPLSSSCASPDTTCSGACSSVATESPASTLSGYAPSAISTPEYDARARRSLDSVFAAADAESSVACDEGADACDEEDWAQLAAAAQEAAALLAANTAVGGSAGCHEWEDKESACILGD